ncbi:MAG TPA: citramalate synthase [Actinomycetes bacterium]|nr:citramalate synthase [Actinomycetes bacterium]
MTSTNDRVETYDTTLRDGAQQVGLQFTVADKLRVTELLDDLGVDVVEGGWPGSNPKDAEYFARARDLPLRHARLAAFGATRRAGRAADGDPNLQALLDSGAPVVTLVGKAWTLHVTEALRTSYDENLAMVADSVAHLRAAGRRVAFDAEHFFDGWAADQGYAMAVVEAAAAAGAGTVVLCDTNGGTLPSTVARVVVEAVRRLPGVRVGVHFHDDAACAVANSLVAVGAGARHVQGAANGYGERCGNADLFAVVAGLELKEGRELLPPGRLAALTATAHAIAELANLPPDHRQPYVGSAAFATKAGLHASAIARRPDAYSHVDPARIGNRAQVLVSELAGRSNVLAKAGELGLDLDADPALGARVLDRVKELEYRGYAFEAADASFELLVRREAGKLERAFELEGYRVIVERRPDGSDISEATVRLRLPDQEGGERVVAVGEGVGPVHALDQALRRALADRHPELAAIRLVDYKVRILDGRAGTRAVTRVLVTSADGDGEWTTVGVSDDVVTASWEALADGLQFGLDRAARAAPVATTVGS